LALYFGYKLHLDVINKTPPEIIKDNQSQREAGANSQGIIREKREVPVRP
jgi:hypothetical protein